MTHPPPRVYETSRASAIASHQATQHPYCCLLLEASLLSILQTLFIPAVGSNPLPRDLFIFSAGSIEGDRWHTLLSTVEAA